jgi:hypothetical protein
MRKPCLLVCILILSAPLGCTDARAESGLRGSQAIGDLWGTPSGLLLPIRSKCITIGEKRICFEDDGENDGPQRSEEGSNERSCPPGYVVLDKPNKYGSLCEPKEGLPKTEAEKCKFPGMVGTPPNCTCPTGTEFFVSRGCVRYQIVRDYCKTVDYPLDYTTEAADIRVRGGRELDSFIARCVSEYHSKNVPCENIGGRVRRCCCVYRTYEK